MSKPASKASVTVREGPQRGQTFELLPVTTVGRSKSCAVSIDDTDASRTHLVIEFEANEYTVRDNGSANGTFLNGRRISTAALRHGDLITLGGTTLTFQIGIGARSKSESSVAASAKIQLGAPPFADVNEKSSVEALATALKKYKVLFETSEILSYLPQGDGFFKLVLEKLLDVTAADRGLVMLGTTESSVELVARLGRGKDAELQPISTTLLKRVLGDGEAILVRDTLLDDRLHDADSVLSTGSRSLICAPLRTTDQTFGAIQLESHSRQSAFDANDLQLLAALARQAAIALSHGRIDRARQEAVDRAALRRFFNPDTVERLIKAPPEWKKGGTQRVSMLFVDLRPLTSTLDAEGLKRVNGVVAQLIDLVFARGGAIARLTPDALLAFWGAPFKEPDDPRRAVETALDMQAAWRREGLDHMRAVAHWGDAFVGEFGTQTRREFAVLGAEVEDTARLTGHLSPGQIGTSEALYAELSTQLEGAWSDPFSLRPGADRTTRLFQVHTLTP